MMTGRRDDEARPTNARPTRRDAPLARAVEQPAGTSPPAALRGRQLEPGHGAPERFDPSQVELAALREAETLDPPELSKRKAVSAPGSGDDSREQSPPPTSVSVEVPRVRSVPPLESYGNVASTGKTRSVHSGTLLSVGGVDPRAPTERRLEAPRMFLSQSEHEAHAYFKAKTVPPMLRPLAEPVATIQIAEPEPSFTEAAGQSSSRLRVAADAGPGRSGRRARVDGLEPDSSVPPAQRFDNPVRSSKSEPKRPAASAEPARPTPSTEPAPVSDGSRPHADLSAFQSEEEEGADPDFDLRGVPTDPEPLARRSRAASDPEMRRASWVPSERAATREMSTLPAPLDLYPEAQRVSLPPTVASARADARKRWLPVAVAALLVAVAAWLGLAARPAAVAPQTASAPVIPPPPAAPLAPAAVAAPLAPALPPQSAPATPSAAAPALPSSTLPPVLSARPADSAGKPLASATSSAALALPNSGLDAPKAPSTLPPAEPAPARKSIY
ncbi:MAG TPA: hypothetical protein VGI10_09210 [Polyangiaceae bacterium]|jgi:hypothetical protein